jgi:hypothetical protein
MEKDFIDYRIVFKGSIFPNNGFVTRYKADKAKAIFSAPQASLPIRHLVNCRTNPILMCSGQSINCHRNRNEILAVGDIHIGRIGVIDDHGRDVGVTVSLVESV